MFAFLRKEEELISTFDPTVYSHTIQRLKEAQIEYRVKATDTLGRGGRRSALALFGGMAQYGVQYQVFVKKNDLEPARQACRK